MYEKHKLKPDQVKGLKLVDELGMATQSRIHREGLTDATMRVLHGCGLVTRGAGAGGMTWEITIAGLAVLAVIEELEPPEVEVKRLRECLRRAGLKAFLSERPPEEVAEHLRDVSASWAEAINTIKSESAAAVNELERKLVDANRRADSHNSVQRVIQLEAVIREALDALPDGDVKVKAHAAIYGDAEQCAHGEEGAETLDE